MSIYSEMLRLTLQAGGDAPATSVADLVADALACRARLPAVADPAGRLAREGAPNVSVTHWRMTLPWSASATGWGWSTT